MAKLNEYGLNPAQEDFCHQLLIDGNRYQAAIRAGYKPNTALKYSKQQYPKNSRLAIIKRIKQLTDEKNAKTEKIAIDVVDELSRLIDTNPQDMLEEVEQEVMKEMPNGECLTFVNKTLQPKPEYKKYFHVEIVNGKAIWKLRPKDKALELLAKIQGLIDRRKEVELSASQELMSALAEINAKLSD